MRPAAHVAQRLCGRRLARAVEVGVDTGFNALVMLHEWGELMGGELRELILVEQDPALEPAIQTRLADYRPNYRLLVMDSAAAAATFPDGLFDFVYLDDDHSLEGVTKSLTAWWPKVRWGGVLGGHDCDVRAPGDGVLSGLQQFFGPLEQPWYVDGIDWWTVR